MSVRWQLLFGHLQGNSFQPSDLPTDEAIFYVILSDAFAGDPSTWTPAQKLYHEIHHPSFTWKDAWEADYPSHLHIDLIARAQGQRQGTRLIATLLSALRAAVRLGVVVAKGGMGGGLVIGCEIFLHRRRHF